MLQKISIEQKMQLSELIAEGHALFGKVNPRRPYRDDDDDEGGSGGSKLVFEQHPLLANRPVGAPSDLTFDVVANNRSLEEAESRADEASPQLRNTLEKKLGMALGQKKAPTKLTPY